MTADRNLPGAPLPSGFRYRPAENVPEPPSAPVTASAAALDALPEVEAERDALRAALRDLLTEWTNTGHSRDPHSDPPSCWKCAEYWPCPAERARLALAAEAQP